MKVKSLSHVHSLQSHGLYPTRLLCPWDFPGNSTEVDCHFLLQGIFPTQGLNLGLLHYRQMLYCLSHQGSLQETQVQSLGREDPLDKGMAIHSRLPAWRMPWKEKQGRL